MEELQTGAAAGTSMEVVKLEINGIAYSPTDFTLLIDTADDGAQENWVRLSDTLEPTVTLGIACRLMRDNLSALLADPHVREHADWPKLQENIQALAANLRAAVPGH